MNRLVFVGILLISTAPLFAQTQPDPAKLKADAEKVVSIIKGDKAKTEAYCQITNSVSRRSAGEGQQES